MSSHGFQSPPARFADTCAAVSRWRFPTVT